MTPPTALITGAGSGIGQACAQTLLAKGYRVIALGRRSAPLEKLADAGSSGSLVPIVADVRHQGSLTSTMAGIDKIDILIANAGICQRTPLAPPQSDAVWQEVIDINLNGVWHTFRAALPKLSDNAAAVVVSSGLGKLGRPGYGAYTASKHAVLGLVKCFSKELAPRGIRVNAVCPGWVDTEMAEADLRTTAEETGVTVAEARAAAESGIPLGRFVTAEEVAHLICWLVSAEASAVTGQSYNISCGEFTV
jgi:NAD(P)-dependent dehydrogenase (short-subunit alcohol dehydrogenase family)